MELKKLMSGSDFRGTALDIYGAKVDLTEKEAYAAAAAFAEQLKSQTGKPAPIAAVGMDSRISSPSLAAAATEGLSDAGLKVLFCGLCSTPSMFMMTKYPETQADGAIMITASHHPADRNGLKFFTEKGGISRTELSAIAERAEKGGFAKADVKGKIEEGDFLKFYTDGLINFVLSECGSAKPFAGMKICLDAGNGAGGFYAKRVLEPLGADVSASQFLEPDGNFPNHAPNPENAEAMACLSKRVKTEKCDIGIIFDTDADRAAMVSSNGAEINRNSLIALVAAVTAKNCPGGTIVTDSVTSDGLREFVEALGLKHLRFKRGYRNVIDEAERLEKEGVSAPVAIETSGHAAFKENYFLDDGAYLVTKLLIEAARLKKESRELVGLISELKVPLETAEIRIKFKTDDFAALGAAVIDNLASVALKEQKRSGKLVPATDNHEGVRISVPGAKGWMLLRMSVHDPVMPVNFESDEAGGVLKMQKLLYNYLSAFSGLDLSALEKAVL